MQSSDIRQLFLEFFRQRGHEVVSSSPLLPEDDPTLLFTNAGMVQFKSVFLGGDIRPYSRAVTVQKCLRAGGKHNDLENVGRTARHHTFFEMLGNFSFGDYFKKEATAWAWEFLTKQVQLPAERLYVTVHDHDDEAAAIWEKEVGVSPERIFRLGDKDNFWQMGDTGPCGPCSEILIDQGAGMGCDRPECRVGCDCDRYLEIWNLVFMQYSRDAHGTLTPLPRPSIDTGMGLERLSAVLQGKTNNFDTDLFLPLIHAVSAMTGEGYGESADTDISLRVIADHIRSAAFVLAEGLNPSNEGRGYVLRRIVRRAARHGYMLGIREPFLHALLDSVYEIMSGPYPEILDNREMSRKVLRFEEECFAHTLSSGMDILMSIIKEVTASGGGTIPGSELFKLYDTYGFPLDLAQDIAGDHNLCVDEKGFLHEMELQKSRARASWTGAEEEVTGIYRDILQRFGPTDFLGYDSVKSEGVITSIIKDGRLIEEAKEGEQAEIILDRTPFYGESGGQVGDTGIMRVDGTVIDVYDTRKFHGLILHLSKVNKGRLSTGMRAVVSVSEERRNAIRRNHTATHILHAALKAALGDHVKQAGSLVAPERLRFDFTHFFALSERELLQIEDIVNEKILQNSLVAVAETSLDDALSRGVTALFGEKYGERVRVVQAGEFSAELCGGTHCTATGEIGPFKILSEASVAAGIRRIEAITGLPAFEYYRSREIELKKAAELLRVNDLKVSERVQKITADLKQFEKELEKLRNKSAAGTIPGILGRIREIDSVKVLAYKAEGLDMKSLRTLADTLKDKMGSGVIILGSVVDSQAYYVSAVTKDLIPRFNAGEILKAVTGGKGGGRADMAQGGTRDISGMDAALSSVDDIIKDMGK